MFSWLECLEGADANRFRRWRDHLQGTRFRPGPGTQIGRDDTIFALRNGKAEFRTSGERRFVSVVESA